MQLDVQCANRFEPLSNEDNIGVDECVDVIAVEEGSNKE